MSEPNIPALIAELKALEAKATPGPWSHSPQFIYAFVEHLAEVKKPEDTALIVTLRNTLPLLLAEIERLRAELPEHKSLDELKAEKRSVILDSISFDDFDLDEVNHD